MVTLGMDKQNNFQISTEGHRHADMQACNKFRFSWTMLTSLLQDADPSTSQIKESVNQLSLLITLFLIMLFSSSRVISTSWEGLSLSCPCYDPMNPKGHHHQNSLRPEQPLTNNFRPSYSLLLKAKYVVLH